MTWAPNKQDVDGCWLWARGRTSAGYGQYRPDGRAGSAVYVHRASYEAYVGPIPSGYQITARRRVNA